MLISRGMPRHWTFCVGCAGRWIARDKTNERRKQYVRGGSIQRAEDSLEHVREVEQRRPPLRPVARAELGQHAQSQRDVPLREDQVPFEPDRIDAVLPPSDELRSEGSAVFGNLELRVIDDPEFGDERGHGRLSLQLGLQMPPAQAAFEGEDVADLEIRVSLLRVDLVAREGR